MDAYRSGTGIEDPGLTAGYTLNTPYVSTVGGGLDSYIPISARAHQQWPFHFQWDTAATRRCSRTIGLAGNTITVRDRNYKPPYVQQFHIGFEYDLPFDSTIEASYVGSRTNDISISHNIDYLSLSNVQLGISNPSYLNAAVPNPFYGAKELSGTTLATPTLTRAQALLPYPQFTGVTETATPIGHSSYNALEVRLNKKINHGFSLLGVYTFSKALEATSYLNPQDAHLDHEISSWDRPSNLDIAGAYEIPVGRGKTFGSNLSPVLDQVIGNWQSNVSFIYMAGTPLLMPTGHYVFGIQACQWTTKTNSLF